VANFNTHFTVAATASATAALLMAHSGLIDNIDIAYYSLMGTLGGMLPDIDADNSIPVKRLFLFLAGLGSVCAWAGLENSLNPSCLMLAVLTTFLVLRYPVFFLFRKMTLHRGVFHSLLGALFFGLLTTCINHYILDGGVLQAWLSGVFIGFGVVVHLLLDELFSVDLSNARMKKSFGTALKLFSYNDIPVSLMLLVSTLGLFIAAPPSARFIQAWSRADWASAINWQTIGDNVLIALPF